MRDEYENPMIRRSDFMAKDEPIPLPCDCCSGDLESSGFNVSWYSVTFEHVCSDCFDSWFKHDTPWTDDEPVLRDKDDIRSTDEIAHGYHHPTVAPSCKECGKSLADYDTYAEIDSTYLCEACYMKLAMDAEDRFCE